MNSIIPFPGRALPRAASPKAFDAWDKYIIAREKAEKSRDIRDGIAAGKAWAEWIDLFVSAKVRRP
jgi:hypothetical protein